MAKKTTPIASAGGPPYKNEAFGDDARKRFAGKNYTGDVNRGGGGVRIAVMCRPNSQAREGGLAGDDLRPEREGRSQPSSHGDMERRERAFPQNAGPVNHSRRKGGR